jgi:hypothetical protein
MSLSAIETTTWPSAILTLGLAFLAVGVVGFLLATFVEFRKLKVQAGQEEALRQLVRRYEQLGENTLDAQQRVAADISEVRSRMASIEQILRTVE